MASTHETLKVLSLLGNINIGTDLLREWGTQEISTDSSALEFLKCTENTCVVVKYWNMFNSLEDCSCKALTGVQRCNYCTSVPSSIISQL